MIRPLLLVLMLAAATHSGVDASERPGGHRRPPEDARINRAESAAPPEQMIATRLVQHLGRFAQPGPAADPQAGFRAAAGILRQAAGLSPDDVEIHRRLATASALAGADPDAAAQADRDLLRLEPDHALAQWRIIERAIDQRQSVTERLDLCQRLLTSAAGDRLAREVRSHIAYRAALLAQEQDHSSVASSWLEESLRHNPTNLDAAALLALETDRRTARRDVLVRALMALVKADPLNAAALSDLIAVVQESGCYRGAGDLIEAMSALASRRGESVSDDLFGDYAMLRAAEKGPREGIDLIRQRQQAFDRAERSRLEQQWARAQQEAHQKALAENRAVPPVEAMPAFEEVSAELSLHVQITRALLAVAAGAGDEAAAALEDLEGRWAAMSAELDAADRSAMPPAALTAIDADKRRVIADRAWIRLWLDLHLDEAVADFAVLEADPAHDRIEVQRLRGWLALRRGDAQAAITWLEPLVSSDPLSALGTALAHEELGRRVEATRLFGEIHLSQPGTLLGVMCKWRTEALQGRSLPMTREARSVERELGRLPQTLGDLILRPQRHFSLTVAPRSQRLGPTDPFVLDVTIRNDSPWPVAIGPDRILSSRLAVFPTFQLAGRRLHTGTPPLVVDLQRRQVLMPSESMMTSLSLDHTLFGLLIPSLSLRPLTVQFQGFLDYQVQPDGSIARLPWSLIRQSEMMHITPWRESVGATGESPGAGFSPSDPHKTMRAISEIAAILHGQLTRILDRERDRDLIAQAEADLAALIDLWPSLDPNVAAWAVLTLPFQKETTADRIEVLDRFEATARRSTEPLIQLAWIAARSSDATDVVIEGAMRSSDPAMRALATDARAFFDRPEPEAPTEEPPAPDDPAIEIEK